MKMKTANIVSKLYAKRTVIIEKTFTYIYVAIFEPSGKMFITHTQPLVDVTTTIPLRTGVFIPGFSV